LDFLPEDDLNWNPFHVIVVVIRLIEVVRAGAAEDVFEESPQDE
jgi:hypothetical protein